MSIENKIDALTAAITALTAAIAARPAVVAQPVEAPATKTVEKVAPAPVVVEAPVAPAPAAAAPEMPPLPAFVAPVEPPKPAAPFSDPKGMIEYVTNAYKAMGPAKGARIQEVITSLGVININEVTPERYGALYTGIEALRNGA